MKLWKKIVIGLVAGIITGFLLGPKACYLKPIGDIFINAIKMLVVPLVFSSLICGITSMNDPKKMGRVGLKTLIYLLILTMIAVSIGLALGNMINPGKGLGLEITSQQKVADNPSLGSTLVNMVPSNPVEALARGNILQIIVFAVLLGVAIGLIGEKGKPLAKGIEALAEVMYKITALVMEIAPYGIFALIAWVTGKYGLETLIPLAKVVISLYAGCILHGSIVFSAVLLLFKLNPIKFYKGIFDAITVAYATSSSSGTLPVTIRCTEENLGVSNSIASFVLPLGATINMSGTAIYQGICAVFISQAYGINLGFPQYATIVFTSIIAAIGTAGVPGSGLIMLSMVLTSVGLPIEGVALVAGIDRVLDMARTALNVTGESLVAVLVAKSEKELNVKIYNGEDVV
jgi:Na+/H+-dicarboxylate symporter